MLEPLELEDYLDAAKTFDRGLEETNAKASGNEQNENHQKGDCSQ